jgi:FlaA1/EpsC-like NDP-sugar epimerase
MMWVQRCATRFGSLSRAAKVWIAASADGLAAPAMLLSALILRRGSLEAALSVPPILYVVAAVLSLTVFASLGMYRAVFRFIAHGALLTAAIGVIASTVLLGLFNYVLLDTPITIRAITIFAVLLLLYLIVSRSLVRELLSYKRGAREKVAIYGAGSAGVQLARSLRDGGQYIPVAFIDADLALQGSVVAGIKVHPPAMLAALIRRKRISSVLLAIPSCTRRSRQVILKSLEKLPVHVRTVPQISDILSGSATVTEVREVDANDLLGREPVAPNEALLDACIRGKVVMVSGAGGSIGSELCRQILRLGPRRLVLLEISEPALYQIDREARLLATSDVEIVPLLGNARHRYRMREMMQTYGVQTVYHAAAYKHVPIVEQNVIEGILNNVFSTWNTAEAALDCRVETFVLVSTDKAVNPTNVMGATKRLAELTLQALQERSTSTRFCMVRFGNVLESSGSVVPLFREQIRRGGPVTVTHRDVVRYFMTIPEAAQLVLQAGAMAQGGDVFVLNMNEPVRIADLAARMIHLMGLTVRDESNPEGDIEIVYTGLRPAEKLYEELLIGNNVTATEHPMIMRATEHRLPWTQLRTLLDEMSTALESLNCAKACDVLGRAVAEYRPGALIYDLVWARTSSNPPVNVTDLTPQRSRQARQVSQ